MNPAEYLLTMSPMLASGPGLNYGSWRRRKECSGLPFLKVSRPSDDQAYFVSERLEILFRTTWWRHD